MSRRLRRFATGAAAILLIVASRPAHSAAQAPTHGLAAPALRLEADEGVGGAGLLLRLEVPEGWSLYTTEPGRIGLPLRATWLGADGGERPVVARWPEGEERHEEGIVVRVYRGRVAAPVEPPDASLGRGAEMLVRWAVCRGDLCVPGTTRLRPR